MVSFSLLLICKHSVFLYMPLTNSTYFLFSMTNFDFEHLVTFNINSRWISDKHLPFYSVLSTGFISFLLLSFLSSFSIRGGLIQFSSISLNVLHLFTYHPLGFTLEITECFLELSKIMLNTTFIFLLDIASALGQFNPFMDFWLMCYLCCITNCIAAIFYCCFIQSVNFYLPVHSPPTFQLG